MSSSPKAEKIVPAPAKVSEWAAGVSSLKWSKYVDETQASGKIALVTGANAGIGKGITTFLAQHGATVLLGCRTESKAQVLISELEEKYPDAKGKLHFVPVDLSDLDTIEASLEAIKAKVDRLDIVFGNAGIGLNAFATTKQGFEQTVGINHVGHFKLIMGLLDLLAVPEKSRVVMTSSGLHNPSEKAWDLDWYEKPDKDNAYGKFDTYAVSKLMNIFFARSLSTKAAATPKYSGITAYSAHPGGVSTEFNGKGVWYSKYLMRPLARLMFRSIPDGATTELAAGLNQGAEAYAGSYWEGGVPSASAKTMAVNDKAQAREEELWARSLVWAGVTDPFTSTGSEPQSEE